MSDWSLSSVLMALLAAIFVPALIIHFTLGRNGGHHLFKDVPKNKVKDLPFEMLQFRLRHQLRGSFATLVGLGVALALYPLACKLGLPLNIFGLSDKQLIFTVTLGVGLLVVGGIAVFVKNRGK